MEGNTISKKSGWQQCMFILPANIYLFKVNKKNTREKCKIYWKLTTAGPGKKGMHANFQKIGKKGQKKGKIFKNFVQKLKVFWKRAGDNKLQ